MTAALLGRALAGLAAAAGAGADPIQVLDAFSAPRVVHDPARRLFRADAAPRAFFGAADAKTQLYVERYLLIAQRVRRHPLFRRARFAGLGGAGAAAAAAGGADAPAELTELKALLGLVGERRFVLGFLTRPEEGRWAIEDLSARLPLDLSGAECAHGLFTENCVVVAEGELTPGGVFRAAAVGLPPAERRADSLAALQGLDAFGGRVPDAREVARWRAAHADDRVIVFSDVWLDRPDVVDRLRRVLAGYAALPRPPTLFVLMGDFQSGDATGAGASLPRLREAFAALGRLLSAHAALRAGSRFLLVPGPGDAGDLGSLPRPPLPAAVAGGLLAAAPHAQLCSNPCRVRHGGRELVLFRSNASRRMRGLAVLPSGAPACAGTAPASASAAFADEAPGFATLVATVAQEAHLCPLPLEHAPVAWGHDHALWLYPLPDALVLAEPEAAAAAAFDACACLNPGPLAAGGFGAWAPVANEVELCDAGEEEEEEGEEEELLEEEELEEEEEEAALGEAAAAAAAGTRRALGAGMGVERLLGMAA